MKKINYSTNKHKWQPSLIPGPIVLISTFNTDKVPNIAPKSWLQMVSFEPSILMFSGSKGNQTENNILETKCFTVNLVDSSIVDSVYKCIQWEGAERIVKSGFKLSDAETINAPIVNNCKAHLECKLIDTKEIGTGFMIFGEIVAVSIDEAVLQADASDRYQLLNQVLFLEDSLYSEINDVRKVQK